MLKNQCITWVKLVNSKFTNCVQVLKKSPTESCCKILECIKPSDFNQIISRFSIGFTTTQFIKINLLQRQFYTNFSLANNNYYINKLSYYYFS